MAHHQEALVNVFNDNKHVVQLSCLLIYAYHTLRGSIIKRTHVKRLNVAHHVCKHSHGFVCKLQKFACDTCIIIIFCMYTLHVYKLYTVHQ